jgi:hypothetical protein
MLIKHYVQQSRVRAGWGAHEGWAPAMAGRAASVATRALQRVSSDAYVN